MGVHPRFPDIRVAIAGHDGDDAKPYAEQSLRTCLAEVARRLAEFSIVTVPDLPGLVTDGRTRAEAAAMREDAIAAWISSLRKWGQSVPVPR